ncbi:MAG: 2,3,4,5-tetrahydropyridine-2,6-dicarboxylate N-succinyltransferase [Legionellaceae bacterium]
MSILETCINHHFESRATLSPTNVPSELTCALSQIFNELDQGHLRVTEKIGGHWVVHSWLKKAILLSFKCYPNQVIEGEFSQFYDKLPLKFAQTTPEEFESMGVRVVPHAMVRRGAYIGKNTILMPSYVNVGAFVDEGVMVDTWATVGSCAHIGKNVHLSGGVGIGGVLEPLQANPTIIEDNCFIGARSEVVEGVIVEQGSVLSMGVFLGQSTKIYNRLTGEISYGRIPAGSVVVPGNLPSQDGTHSLYCAVIVKHVDEKTREKVSINELLRDITP